MAHNPPSVEADQAFGAQARQSWRTRAACQGHPELIRGGPGEQQRRNICFRCPVLGHCRDWALSLPPASETDDIAGGLTARQRRAIRRARLCRIETLVREDPAHEASQR